jgi:hypothetical protein
MIRGVPASEVPDVWPSIKKFLDKPIELSNGRLSNLSVLDALLEREMQLWLAVDKEVLGAMVTQIVTYPTGLKVLSVVLIGGKEMNKWIHLWPQIEEWGKSHGCKVVEIPRGRWGWSRVLKDWNAMTFMEKKI